jgi:hypothetical protein
MTPWEVVEARVGGAQTGRLVVNEITATHRFADGLIVDHRDEFNFHRWAGQALGPVGLLLGWTPIVRAGVRRNAGRALDAYLAKQAAA